MDQLLFALLACFAVSIGGRDQLLLADLGQRSGGRWTVLGVALAVTLVSSAAAVWAAGVVAPGLAGPARTMLAALAIGFGGAEMLLSGGGKPLAEPTQSLGALAIVLLARQLTDAARLAIFALAAAGPLPLGAGIGGAAGSGGAMVLGWGMGAGLPRGPLGRVRRALGLVLLVLAAALAWRARQG